MGKWIELETDASTGKPYLWKCDECGEEVETKWNYCPECGDPKTSKGKSINTLVKALETEHRKLREMQKAQPEIIHCNDCQHSEYDAMYGDRYCHHNGKAEIVPDDHYCGYAERRTDERSD